MIEKYLSSSHSYTPNTILNLMRRLLISTIIMLLMLSAIGTGTLAVYSDTETSTGNIFEAASINLKVGDTDPSTWNFSHNDVKPGDTGEEEVVLQNTGSIDGYLHINTSELINQDLGCNGPELAEDMTCGNPGDGEGELASSTNVRIYLDVNNNNVFDLGGDVLVYYGTGRGALQGDEWNFLLAAGSSVNVRMEWEIPALVGNVAQSDKLGFDLSFTLSQVMEDSVGDWHLDESTGTIAYDVSGNGNHGNLVGPIWSEGKWNPALQFDGIDDEVIVSDSLSLDPTGKVSLEAWVNTTSSETQIIIRKTYGYEIFVWNGHLGALIGTGNTWSAGDVVEGSTVISDGAWHHVAMTYDDVTDTIKLYVDGVEDFSSSGYSVSLGASAFDLYLGAWDDGTGSGFFLNGRIDEPKVWKRVLTPSEVSVSHANGL